MSRSPPSDLQRCRDLHLSRYAAYYNTVLLSVGMKDMFASTAPCSFKVSEPLMRTSSSESARPDAIFQCDGDTKGIVCEIKSSLPLGDGRLLDDVRRQVDKYSRIRDGWITDTGRIGGHSVFLLVHRTDVKRLRRLLYGPKGGRAPRPDAGLCLGYWVQTRSMRPGARDVIILSREVGSTGCEYFDKRLDGDIEIPVESTLGGYERRKFVKSDPPDLYMLDHLYQSVFPNFAGADGDAVVDVDVLTGNLMKYYASWSGLAGERSQIRPRWVGHAMRTLCRIGLAVQLPGGSRYLVKLDVGQKNTREFLLSKLCSAGAAARLGPDKGADPRDWQEP